MGWVVPPGWEQDSQTLYVHSSRVRIELRMYRKKEGWVLVPVDLDRAVIEFPPTGEGLEQAFGAFVKGALEPGETGTSKEVMEARKAARRDENPYDSPDNDHEGDDEEDDP